MDAFLFLAEKIDPEEGERLWNSSIKPAIHGFLKGDFVGFRVEVKRAAQSYLRLFHSASSCLNKIIFEVKHVLKEHVHPALAGCISAPEPENSDFSLLKAVDAAWSTFKDRSLQDFLFVFQDIDSVLSANATQSIDFADVDSLFRETKDDFDDFVWLSRRRKTGGGGVGGLRIMLLEVWREQVLTNDPFPLLEASIASYCKLALRIRTNHLRDNSNKDDASRSPLFTRLMLMWLSTGLFERDVGPKLHSFLQANYLQDYLLNMNNRNNDNRCDQSPCLGYMQTARILELEEGLFGEDLRVPLDFIQAFLQTARQTLITDRLDVLQGEALRQQGLQFIGDALGVQTMLHLHNAIQADFVPLWTTALQEAANAILSPSSNQVIQEFLQLHEAVQSSLSPLPHKNQPQSTEAPNGNDMDVEESQLKECNRNQDVSFGGVTINPSMLHSLREEVSKDVLQKVLNASQARARSVTVALAKYLDHCIRHHRPPASTRQENSQNRCDDSMTWLEGPLRLFRMLPDTRALFEAAYKAFLARRLLGLNASSNIASNSTFTVNTPSWLSADGASGGSAVESAVLKALHAVCGLSFTSRMEGMLRDALNSGSSLQTADFRAAFLRKSRKRTQPSTANNNDKLADNKRKLPDAAVGKCEFVLCTQGLWPNIPHLNLLKNDRGDELDSLQEAFGEWYQKGQRHRRIHWSPLLSHGAIRLQNNTNGGEVVLDVNGLQLAILEVLSKKKLGLSLHDLLASLLKTPPSQEQSRWVGRALQGLLAAKVIAKANNREHPHPQNNIDKANLSIHTGDIFSLSAVLFTSFLHPKKLIKVSMPDLEEALFRGGLAAQEQEAFQDAVILGGGGIGINSPASSTHASVYSESIGTERAQFQLDAFLVKTLKKHHADSKGKQRMMPLSQLITKVKDEPVPLRALQALLQFTSNGEENNDNDHATVVKARLEALQERDFVKCFDVKDASTDLLIEYIP